MVNAKKFNQAVSGRKQLLARVHIAKKELGICDEDYRAILAERFDVGSAADLTVPQLSQLVEHFRALGWKASATKKPRKQDAKPGSGSREFVRIDDADPQARQKRYILALAKKLGWSLSGLQKRIQKQFGVARIEWLHDQASLQVLTKDLYNRCLRAGLDPKP